MELIKLGLIGCGVIGHKHAQGAMESDIITLDAVADLNKEAAQKLAQKYGVENVYESGDSLLEESDAEAVILALPTGVRLPLALKAFKKGKHVLVEKPVAMCADDVKKMIKAQGSLTAGCCSSRLRFLENADEAGRFIKEGNLGNIRLIRCRAVSPADVKPENPRPAWRLKMELNGGGIMANWGSYDLDYLLGILGWSLEPDSVFARTWQIPTPFRPHVVEGSDAETHAAALVSFKQGCVLQFERGEYMTAPDDTAWQIIGEKGTLDLAMVPWKGSGITFTKADTEQGAVSENLWEGDDNYSEIPKRLLEDFAQSVRENRQPRTGLEQALIVQKITDAIYKSSDTGKCVKVK